MRAPPEPLPALAEACQRYFPGKSPCALRWMIKRRGYAHSRWGREYRLTPSQVAAIVDDLARPANPPHAEPRGHLLRCGGPASLRVRSRPQQLPAPPRLGPVNRRAAASGFEAGAGGTLVGPGVGHSHLSRSCQEPLHEPQNGPQLLPPVLCSN